MASSFSIAAPINNVAAVLTASEFLFATITALLARRALQGFDLVHLHTRGSLCLNRWYPVFRSRSKDVIILLLGLWLVVAVSLVESGLSTSFQISSRIAEPPGCVRMDTNLSLSMSNFVLPPVVRMKEWTSFIASSSECRNSSFRTVYSAVPHNSPQTPGKVYSPTCLQDQPPFRSNASENITWNVGTLNGSPSTFEMSNPSSPTFEILPFSLRANRFSKNSSTPVISDDIGDMSTCETLLGHSLTAWDSKTIEGEWESALTDYKAIWKFIAETVCIIHGQQPVSTVPQRALRLCSNFLEGTTINMQCLARKSKTFKYPVYSATMDNSAVLLHSEGLNLKKYTPLVCLNATITINYVLAGFFKEQISILPVSVQVLDGICERTLPFLGRAALLHTVFAEWENTDFAKLDRWSRYRSLLLDLAPSVLNLATLQNSKEPYGQDCEMSEIDEVTLLHKNSGFYFLLVGVILSFLFCLLGLLMLLVFRNRRIEIGTTEWAFHKLAEKKYQDKAAHLVVRTHLRQEPSPSDEENLPMRTYSLTVF